MINHSIIKNTDLLESFIRFLPDVEPSECYSVYLFARNKYHSSVGNGRSVLKRVFPLSKADLLSALKQMEVSVGCYTNKDGSVIHQDGLALYMNINPRDMKKAQVDMLKLLADKVGVTDNFQSVKSMAMTTLQKSKSKTRFVDFDFDVNDSTEVKEKVKSIFKNECYKFLMTRGGVHVLVDVEKVEKENKTWYNDIKNLAGCDVSGDMLIPIPGCTQGGFVPYFED